MVNIRQVYWVTAIVTSHSYIILNIRWVNMSASDTALSANIQNLEVQDSSAFNTPTSGTPIPTTSVSSETTSLLQDVANKLKDPVSTRGKGMKRKRVMSPATSPDSRGQYPPAAKPLYLRAKNLYRKKLNLATNLHSVRSSLKSGSFPPQCNFRSSPPESSDASFKQKWVDHTSKCKRDLTLLWTEEMNRKYSGIKGEIQGTLAELETVLDQAQFKEIKDSLTTKFQSAAPATLQKKLKPNLQNQKKTTRPNKKVKQGRRPQNPNKQLNLLLNGLSRLIQNKSK